ncbi:DMT family transporter [Paenibacillus shunpengii]|uniref:DMT family transporter n=1 Tax=Paenibacillus shunpengii TaxID=2054424 RepID=A0ABW5SNQ4_9BACL|nr:MULTISPECIES: DMT family transporter [unclassified Paenibacillus]OMC68370.1 EamA family transporter [Paenibacillus sp. FSL H7-0326]SDW63571.1 EamA domain-containing membrane protein RarD [Paenibacillus sp. PDC88]
MEHTNKKALPAAGSTGFWLVALGAALWGIGPLFRIHLLDYMTSTQVVLIEHLLVCLVAVPILWVNRSELKNLRLKHVFALLVISWGGSALATVIFTMALSSGDLNAVVLLQKMQPIFAILLAKLILKETLPKRFGFFFIIAIVGTYLLTFGFTIPFGTNSEWIKLGSLLSLLAAALWGGSTVMGRLLLGQAQYKTVTSLRYVLALPLLLIMTWLEGASMNLPQAGADLASIGVNLLAQALLPGLLSLLLYYKGLSSTKASMATLAELSFPMMGVLVNWIAFGQLVTPAQLIGFVLIWTTLFIFARQQQQSSQQLVSRTT